MEGNGSSREEGACSSNRSPAPPSVPAAATGYRTLVPTLPTGKLSENSVFLHGDLSARPYRIDDIAAALSATTDLTKITGLGPFQFNHVWMVTFQTAEDMKSLASKGEIEAKGKRCLVIDPNNQEKAVKLHWVPTTVPNELLVRHLERFGEVKNISFEKWRRPGMGHMGSTTRIIQISPRNVNSLDALPHQVKMYGNMVLIEVPGRPAICLRCQQLGHMRRQCTTPWCRACRGFGHDSSACEQSYAARARGMRTTQPLDDFMDIEKIQETMTSQPFSQSEVTRAAKKNERDEAPANASAPGEVTTTNSSSTERVIAEERDATVDPVESDEAAAPCPLQKTTPEIDGVLHTQSTFLPPPLCISGALGTVSAEQPTKGKEEQLLNGPDRSDENAAPPSGASKTAERNNNKEEASNGDENVNGKEDTAGQHESVQCHAEPPGPQRGRRPLRRQAGQKDGAIPSVNSGGGRA